MAQTITCDFEGCSDADGLPTPANWLVSRQDQGETLAWCDAHYLELCRALVANVNAQPEPEPEPTGNGSDEPLSAEEEDRIAARLARLGEQRAAHQAAAEQPVDQSAGSDSPQAPSVAPGPAGEPVEDSGGAPTPVPAEQPGPNVVRRGQSASRRKHEAKKRARARAAAESEATE